MDKIESNKGDFTILQQLPGAEIKDHKTPKPETKQKQTDEPEWEAKAQRRWLSIHNDFLFTPW